MAMCFAWVQTPSEIATVSSLQPLQPSLPWRNLIIPCRILSLNKASQAPSENAVQKKKKEGGYEKLEAS
jgi:hypothetical protein